MIVCRSNPHRLYFLAHLSLINLFALTATLPASAEPTLQWIRQFGTDESDQSRSVSIDPHGNVFVSGTHNGNGGFLSKYDLEGDFHWTREFDGTQLWEATADGLGNVILANGGSSNPRLEKYDTAGNLLWSRPVEAGDDVQSTKAPSIDSDGNLFVTGATVPAPGSSRDAYLTKLDGDGNTLWTSVVDLPKFEYPHASAIDRFGNSVVVGYERDRNRLGNENDAMVLKFDAMGNLLWNRTFDSGDFDSAQSVAVDDTGNVFVAGYTRGNVAFGAANNGSADAYLRKYSANGEVLWTRQYGGPGTDYAYGLALDAGGNAYLTGSTASDVFGSFSGFWDAYVAKIDPTGNLIWSHQFGTEERDISKAIAIDALGNIVVGGLTGGDLGGPNAGGVDGWIALFRDVLPGDFSGDGLIDNADLTLLLNYWGDPATPAPAAWTGHLPTGDAIDNSELTALLNAWGQGTLAQGTGATQIPEPASALLFLWATIALVARRRGARPPRRC